MTSSPEEMYQQAKKQLSALVLKRNELLLRLETLATVPLTITPASGHVAQFDAEEAARLLRRIQQQTALIAAALDEVNRYAGQAGQPGVNWVGSTPPAPGFAPADE